MAYIPLVYRTSGGDELVISTGGNLAVAGTITFGSGGTLTLAGQAVTTTGAVTGDNLIFTAVAAASSGSTGFASYGVTQIWSCAVTTGHVFTMPAAAAAGTQKWITCNISTSTAPAVVTLADTLIAGSATLTFSTGATNTQWIHLFAQNTTNWFVVGKSTDVTISA